MSSPSFTSHDDLCGFRLQSLVCRGHCLITKVLKSSNEIPPVFLSGYTIDDFAAAYFINPYDNNKKSKNKGNDSYFFGSTVMNIFGGGKGLADAQQQPWKKIRSQAPSYRYTCTGNHLNSRLGNESGRGSGGSSSLGDITNSADDVEKNKKFISILVDFSYLSNPEKFDSMNNDIQTNNRNNVDSKLEEELKVKRRKYAAEQEHSEREFAMTYQSTLKKYYTMFEEIYNFYLDVNSFISDLDRGNFVQYNLRSLLLECNEARQLLCEVLYLCGSLLILLDMYIPGEIRERLIIAHYRFCESNGSNGKASNFEELCKMFQRTDYHNSHTKNNSTTQKSGHVGGGSSRSSTSSNNKQKRDHYSQLQQPQIQPELLSRIHISSVIVKSIIECLISVDLYPKQPFAFPSYEHRSSKLGQQAAMLFVVLFFTPKILKNDASIMRQIVDKFFHDTWVVPLYNGTVIDLSIEWSIRFPAAMDALDHVINVSNVEKLNYENMKVTISCLDEVKRYLAPKVLTTAFLLDHGRSILDFLRAANAALRWQILHRTSYLCPKADNSTSAMIVDEHDILSLILLLSQLEVQVIEAYNQVLKCKKLIWSNCQNEIMEKLTRLSKHFFGNDSLNTVERDEGLGQWFQDMVDEIQSLDFHNEKAGGEIQLCIEALDDAKQLDLIDSSLPSIDIIEMSRTNLVHMAKSANIKDDICSTINLIADFTYAREIMESLVPMLHSQSMRDPKSVTLLRAFFLKMGKPNARLQELADRPQNDLTSVTEFHETAMLAFVKETLDVIPITIFSTLAHIADEKSLAQVPAKIEADRLADYLHFKDRYNLAKITYELSVLTKGIFAMKKTLIGNLEIKPKSLLEEGLRKELVRQYSRALHDSLQFYLPTERSKQALVDHINSCTEIFTVLGNRIEGFQRSMIWLQDFLEIDGLDIFIHETGRVVKVYVDHELMNTKHKSSKVLSQTDDGVPIPLFTRSESDPSAATFIGRTMNALLQLTDFKYSTYSNSLHGWYFSSGEQVCSMRTISTLRNAIGVDGLLGIERLLCCKNKNELSRFFKFYSNIQTYGVILEQFRDAIYPEWKCPKNGLHIYEVALKKTMKLMIPLTKSFCRIGQVQLLRKSLWNDLRLAADPKVAQLCTVANKFLMSNLGYGNNTIEFDNSIQKCSDMIVSCGLTDPMATIFSRTNSLEGLPSLITVFVINTMRELNFDSDFGALVGKEDESIDGWAIVAGIATVLKQFNATYTKSLFALLGQYVKCALASHLEKARVEELPRISKEVQNILIFMRQLRSIANLESSIIFDQIPQHLIEMIDSIN